jgi:hypothetical protein
LPVAKGKGVDASFLAVVFVSLCLLSGLIVVRLGAGGASAPRILVPVAELWITFGLWILLFRSLAAVAGTPHGASGVDELHDIGARLAALTGAQRWWMAAVAAVAVALCGHLLWSLRRAMATDHLG